MFHTRLWWWMLADESGDCRDVVRHWELLNPG
jgi:hypothetical protein